MATHVGALPQRTQMGTAGVEGEVPVQQRQEALIAPTTEAPQLRSRRVSTVRGGGGETYGPGEGGWAYSINPGSRRDFWHLQSRPEYVTLLYNLWWSLTLTREHPLGKNNHERHSPSSYSLRRTRGLLPPMAK